MNIIRQFHRVRPRRGRVARLAAITGLIAAVVPAFAQPAGPPAPARTAPATNNAVAPAAQANTNTPARRFTFPALPAPPPESAVPAAAAAAAANPLATTGTNQPGSKAQAAAMIYGKDPNEIIASDFMQLNNMELSAVFELYSEFSGRIVLKNVAVGAGTLTLKVPIPLTRLEAVETLDAALAQNNITMIPFGDKWVKAVPAAASGAEGMAMSEGDARKLPEADTFVTQVIPLKYARPSEVVPLLATFTKNPGSGIIAIESSQLLVVRDYASNVKRIAELLAKIDISPPPDYKIAVIPVRYGRVDDLYATMSSLIGGASGSALGSTRGAARRSLGGTSPRYGQNGTLQGGQFGQQGVNGINPLNPNPGANMNNFQNRVSRVLGQAGAAGANGQNQIISDARIVPDEQSNSLLIYANDHDMEMISNIVERVDHQLPQVLIEAVVLDVSLNKSLNVGVSYLQNPQTSGKLTQASGANNGPQLLSSVTNLSSGLPSGFSYFAKYGGSLEAAVQALASDSTVSVIATPRVQTSHAVPGSFLIGTAVPYITGFQTYSGYVGGASSSSTVQEKDINTDIEVTPFITPDGLVVMDIDNSFDEPGPSVNIGGNPYPVVNQRHASSTLTVRDGETIMLGGYITTTKTKSISGVPFLMKIPLLGALFRSTDDESQREELIVLMRATILRTTDDASNFATKERKTLPGIRMAEDQENKFRSDRLKQVEKEEQHDRNLKTNGNIP